MATNDQNQQATPAQPASAQAAPTAQQQSRREPATAPRQEPQRLQIDVVHHQQPVAPAPTHQPPANPPAGDNSFLNGLAAFVIIVAGVIAVMLVWSALFTSDNNKQANINNLPPVVNNWGRGDMGFPGEGRSGERGLPPKLVRCGDNGQCFCDRQYGPGTSRFSRFVRGANGREAECWPIRR